jgi:hypothetical protein
VTRLHDLGESREQIADLTGMRLVEVRAMLVESAAVPDSSPVAAAPTGPGVVSGARPAPVATAPRSGGEVP